MLLLVHHKTVNLHNKTIHHLKHNTKKPINNISDKKEIKGNGLIKSENKIGIFKDNGPKIIDDNVKITGGSLFKKPETIKDLKNKIKKEGIKFVV